MYDTYECFACGEHEEIQEHVIDCKELLKMNKEVISDVPKYDKLFEATVKEQSEIARLFKQIFTDLKLFAELNSSCGSVYAGRCIGHQALYYFLSPLFSLLLFSDS